MFKFRIYILIFIVASSTLLLGANYYSQTKEKKLLNIAFEEYQKDQVKLWLSKLHADVLNTYELNKNDYYYYNLLNDKKFAELSERDNNDLLYLLYQNYNKSGLAKSGDTAIGVFIKKELPIAEVCFVYVSTDDKLNHMIKFNKDKQNIWSITNIESKVGEPPLKLQTLSIEEFAKNYNSQKDH
ncbi:hypothetical protein [Paenibacillus sp. P36]|uniref:hypothetical protein n=1 Tax=Paenibacillus sp. P36 TaxID=3342538 RepID=UPI0038B4164A